ncbi:hypothetical protein FQR65_LT20834 [Abscondita terminalis]|nr:hypothetical protein FQR65_LT20834 [Abscondita terminalis]
MPRPSGQPALPNRQGPAGEEAQRLEAKARVWSMDPAQEIVLKQRGAFCSSFFGTVRAFAQLDELELGKSLYSKPGLPRQKSRPVLLVLKDSLLPLSSGGSSFGVPRGLDDASSACASRYTTRSEPHPSVVEVHPRGSPQKLGEQHEEQAVRIITYLRFVPASPTMTGRLRPQMISRGVDWRQQQVPHHAILCLTADAMPYSKGRSRSLSRLFQKKRSVRSCEYSRTGLPPPYWSWLRARRHPPETCP